MGKGIANNVTEGRRLARRATWRPTAIRLAAGTASAVCLTLCFPPAEIGLLAWVAFVPILALSPPPRLRGRFLLGWVFGCAHFATSLLWLNTIGFGAGFLLALLCAPFPMVWYVLASGLRSRFKNRQARPTPPPDADATQRTPCPLRACAAVLFAAASWVALEWTRGWVFTGFPWNQVGVSQWDRALLLRLSAVTGVHGISFLVLVTNGALVAVGRRVLRLARGEPAGRVCWPVVLAAALFLVTAAIVWRVVPPLPPADGSFTVLAVQGNIPLCREWTEADFEESLGVYSQLTRLQATSRTPDLIVWPESAVPAPLSYTPYYRGVTELLEEVRAPLLVGAIHHVPTPPDTDPLPMFNSAYLLDGRGRVEHRYDKVHPVPFGEYTPFEDLLPWLSDIIGMGRSLTAGRNFLVFPLRKGVRAGVNICYEDAYADISRQFTLRGANVLMALTNDAWYAESSGSRQHQLHAVFRAVECQRPMFRAGNNSHTCLITPDGRIASQLEDPVTGSPFVRAAAFIDIPVWDSPPLTPYARFGDWFAALCALATGVVTVCLVAAWFQCRRRCLEAVAQRP